MSIESRINALIQEFNSFDQWEDRYKEIIGKGKDLAAIPENFRTEENKIKGCQSQVWLAADLEDGRVVFFADSDASIVKGIVALLVSIYSGSTPDEILTTPPDFLSEIGLRDHLSMSRANGLSSMLKQISMYALAFKVKLQQS